jgi:hypothetical protein
MAAAEPRRPGPSKSEDLKRFHVRVNDLDTTVSLDIALYDRLKELLARDGETVRHWAQTHIDALIAQSPNGTINRRTTCLSRRLTRQALLLMMRRLEALEAQVELLHSLEGSRKKPRRKRSTQPAEIAEQTTAAPTTARQLLSKKPQAKATKSLASPA